MAVQGLGAFGGGGHGFGVGQAAGQRALHEAAAQACLGGAGGAGVDEDGALAECGARDQGDDGQGQSGRRLGQAARQGAHGQGQASGEADGRHGVGDHQRPAQTHHPPPGRQGGLQPQRGRLGRGDSRHGCLSSVDRLGRHYVS
ncbi:hypothetical protein D3C80_1327330 [compost metagenome]